LGSIRETLRRHFPELIIGWGDPAHVLAATVPGLITIDPAEMSRRYARRSVKSPTFDPAWFAGATDWLDLEKVAQRAADLDAAEGVTASTDLKPSIYLQRLALWEAAAGAGAARRDFVDTASNSWLSKWCAAGVFDCDKGRAPAGRPGRSRYRWQLPAWPPWPSASCGYSRFKTCTATCTNASDE
jgi:hypothetical protein